MSETLEYVLINSFKCKRCGCSKYDKLIYTGDKTLDHDDSIIQETYVCRNCDLPFNILNYANNNTLKIDKTNLLKESIIINENLNNEGE